jgi:hypothetical protein
VTFLDAAEGAPQHQALIITSRFFEAADDPGCAAVRLNLHGASRQPRGSKRFKVRLPDPVMKVPPDAVSEFESDRVELLPMNSR